MLDAIIAALQTRTDVQSWSVKYVDERSAQLYAESDAVEASRVVRSEQYAVGVLRDTTEPGGPATCGTARVTVLPGDDVARAIDEVAFMAGLVHNPPHGIPGPMEMPVVPLVDPELQADPRGMLDRLYERLTTAAARHRRLRLTAAEFFGTETTTHFVNSRGIDATQVETDLALEWVLIARSDQQETETFVELSRRRAADIDIEGEVDRRAQYALDLLRAQAAPNYTGPVALRGEALANFICGDLVLTANSLFVTLGSAQAKFSRASQWEIGQSIFRGEVMGDPLTLWANRRLPYGTRSNCFDDEGVPAQRVGLIQDNKLTAFTASQRYADYLSVPVTGAFGNIEVAAGQTPEANLLAAPHVEIVSFSWFNPDAITGEFATEIRLGYLVDGERRTPFRGGMLVGNVLDALANVQWSRETGFYGDYQGPRSARFAQLIVAGNA